MSNMKSPQKSSGWLGKILPLLVLSFAAGLAVHLFRPDLSPFDGRLRFAIVYQRIGDLKPGASLRYEGAVVGVVESVLFDKATDTAEVNVLMPPEHKTLARSSTRFTITHPLLGLGVSHIELRVPDLNAPRIGLGARVEGVEGFAGKAAKLRKKIEKSAEELRAAIEETLKPEGE